MLPWVQPIDAGLGAVPQQQTVVGEEFLLQSCNGSQHAVIVVREGTRPAA